VTGSVTMKYTMENRMKIIIKNIPRKTKRKDIKEFLKSAVNGSWLSKTGKIQSISILPLKNIRTRIVHYHALVEILPDIVAERVIKKLNKKIMLGKCVVISEYKTRALRNDLRNKNNNIHDDLKNRRICDRRDEYEHEHEDIYITASRVLFFDKN
jgi:hypothetical protein